MPAHAARAAVLARQGAKRPASRLNATEIDAVVKQLESPEPEAWYRASDTLAGIGDPAVPSLLEGLEKAEDADAKVRIIRTLGRVRSPRAAAHLECALRNGRWHWDRETHENMYPESEAAGWALAQIGPPAVPYLARYLADEMADFRLSKDVLSGDRLTLRPHGGSQLETKLSIAEQALREIGTPEALRWVRTYELVRDLNVAELAKMGEPAVSIAASILQRLLLTRYADTSRVYTEGGMSGHGWGDRSRPADPTHGGSYVTSDVGDLRAAVARELGNLGSPKSIDALIAALSFKGYSVTYQRNRYYDGISGSIPRHTEVLFKYTIYASTEDISEQAARALAKLGKAAVPALMKALKSRRRDVRFYAAAALALIGDERVNDGALVEILRPQLFGFSSGNITERKLSREALGVVRSRSTPEEWAAYNRATVVLERSVVGVLAFLSAVLGGIIYRASRLRGVHRRG